MKHEFLWEQSLWEQSLLAMNDNAVFPMDRGAAIASKLCSHRRSLISTEGYCFPRLCSHRPVPTGSCV
jgi:hypothetical protein